MMHGQKNIKLSCRVLILKIKSTDLFRQNTSTCTIISILVCLGYLTSCEGLTIWVRL